MLRKYSAILRTLCNPSIFEPWHTQNPGIFRTRSICRTLAYSEQRYIQNPRQIQNPVKQLRWSIVQELLIAVVVFANYNLIVVAWFTFSLCFSGSKFLINLWQQFGVGKIFHTQVFAGSAVFPCYVQNHYFENV